jgi:predicted lipoprotein with Yx(FWY)xxD motif
MLRSNRFLLPFLLAALALLGWTALATAASRGSSPARLARVGQVSSLGRILVTNKGFALYHWTQEKHGQIRCTGQCARVWPPLMLAKGTTAAKTIPGVAGTFGVVIRPNKTRQLTYDGMALYTYVDDTQPGEALCQGAEGWYVIQASSR